MADDYNVVPLDEGTSSGGPVGTAGDFAKTLGAGAAGIGSNMAANARYFFDAGGSEHGAAISKSIGDIFGALRDGATESMNPETQKLAAATMTSDKFWEHPLLATALKTTGMLPAVAAAAIPGGLLAEAVGATVIAAGTNAALSSGGAIDEFYKKLDAASDEELAAQSPKFKVMLDTLGSKLARRKFAVEAQGWAPAINAVLGAATGVVGPAGTAARALTGGAENAVVGAAGRGAIGSAAVGAAEGASTNALQSGVEDYTSQKTDIEAGFAKEMDAARTANAALEGGVLGGILGGAAGGALGGKKSPEAVKRVDKALDKVDAATPETVSTPQNTNGKTGTATPPPATADVGNVQNAPSTGGPRDASKTLTLKGKKKPTVQVVDAVAPDAGQAAAIKTNEGADLPTATEDATPPVQAALKRLQDAQTPVEAPTPAPEPTSAPVDTGMNVPERPETLDAQIDQLKNGQRAAVMYPVGTKPQPVDGFATIKTPRGMVVYDPRKISVGELLRASRKGHENEFLNLGSIPKDEAIARANAGETPTAVVERTPDGTEVRAAAGTHKTAPGQMAEMAPQTTPGNTLVVETPEQVIAGRVAPKKTGRVLRDLRSPEQAATIDVAKNLGEGVKVDEEGNRIMKGRNMGPKARSAIEARAKAADEIVARHAPAESEDTAALVARAQKIFDEALAAGQKMPAQLKPSVNKDQASDIPAVQRLTLARDLVRASKSKRGAKLAEAAERFRVDEADVIAGRSDEMLARRRADGEAAMRRDQGSVEDVAAAQTDDLPKGAEDAVETQSLDEKSAAVDTSENRAEAPTIRSKTTSDKGGARGVDAPTVEREVKLADGTVEKVEVAAGNEVRKIKPSDVDKQRMIEELDRLTAKNKARTPEVRMREAAANVDTNPSPAQIEAGNYRKGHVTVNGLDVAIENPRGSIRRGVDVDGRPWEAKVAAHYGYIKGTLGADGDHVDTFIGNGKRHFVIDQLDHRTGEFDEHKVMMNFHNEMEALRTYRASFSDGRANDRIGNVHELTTSELKEWVHSGATKDPITSHVFGDGAILDPYDAAGNNVRALKTSTAAEELGRIDFSHVEGVPGVVAPYIQKQLIKLVGDVPVHYVRAEDLAKLGGRELAGDNTGAYGVHVDYGSGRSEIYINIDKRNEPGQIAQTLMHEASHSSTQREITENAKYRAEIGYVSDQVRDWAMANAPERFHVIENAFLNEHEFMAEADSNPTLQNILAQIPVDAALRDHLKLGAKPKNMWEVVLHYVQRAIEKVTGRLPGDPYTMLHAMMKIGATIRRDHELGYPEHAYSGGKESTPESYPRSQARDIVKDATDSLKRVLEDRALNTAELAPKLIKLRGFDNIAQISDGFFGENNPVRKIQQLVERTRITSQGIVEQSGPTINKLAALQSKYTGEKWNSFAAMLHDASIADVDPSKPLPKANTTLANAWGRAQHAELSRAYDALPADLKAGYKDAVKHYNELQTRKVEESTKNQLAVLGHDDAALLKRFMGKTTTEEDKALLGGMHDTIAELRDKMTGGDTYAPLIRHGDYVVRGTINVPVPANAKAIHPNEFEFKTRKEATDYAEKSALQAEIKSVYVDEKTGELHFVEDGGTEIKVTKQDLQGENRFRVKVQNEHVEFHEEKTPALRRRAELIEEGLDMKQVEVKKFEPGGRQAVDTANALHNVGRRLEKSDAYKNATPTQQAVMKRTFEEASLQARGSTRITARNLPRRGVRGYSQDVVRNMAEYTTASAHTIAKLEHGPALEAAQKEMNEQLNRDASKTGQYARSIIANEVTKRLADGGGAAEAGGKFSQWVRRAMAVSFIDKLGSPAYSVVNAMQPAMVTMPVLAGKHGVGRSVAALSRAYNDIGAGNIAKRGVKETIKRLKGSDTPDDFIGDVFSRANITANEKLMLQHMRDTGYIDPSAGMEIVGMKRDYGGVTGRIDKGIAYMEGVTREMPRAIEAISRMATGLSAYRLEIAKGASHEKALQYAGDTISKTQFNYSPSNNPRIFNHPLAKVAFQFKNYGRNMYQLIGDNIGRALRPMEPGQRAEAIKTLAGIVATHTAMAGALGLPTEPFKYLLMGANALGVTGSTWGDVENKFREGAANVLGKTAGEALSRGLPRLVGLDLGRMGLDSVTSFGEPRTNKEADVKSWFFDNAAGPVASLGVDWIKGVQDLGNGDMLKAAEKLVPIKAAADSLRAYRQFTEGKKSSSGNQSSAPYSPTEAGLRALGFTPGREAEESAARSAYFSKSQSQKDTVASLTKDWVDATPAGKSKAFAAITAYNKGVPDEARITMKQLTAKLKAREKNATEGELGIVASKRDKRFLENSPYNR
jgi:hypothetical protein